MLRVFYQGGNSYPAQRRITVGLHGPVLPREHTVLSMARHIQVSWDWCPVINTAWAVPHNCGCRVIRTTNRKEAHRERPELPTENIMQTQPRGSYRTRVGRERQLTAIANQLKQLGYRKMGARS